MYTLYGFPKTRAFRITWALEELQLDYNYHLVNIKTLEQRTPEFRAISPTGKVPLLGTPGGELSDSAAILQYLAQQHGAPLLPESLSDIELGRVLEMQLFLATEFEQPLWLAAKHTFALPEEQRVEGVVKTAAWEYQKALGIFATMLGDRPYAAGEHFSYADIYATHTLNWAKGSKMPCEYDNVNQYHEKLVKRDAYLRAVEREKAELAKV